MASTKRFVVDLVERSAATFAEAFLAVWIVAGADLDQLFTLHNVKVAGGAGVLAVAKALLARLRGRKDSASLAPSV